MVGVKAGLVGLGMGVVALLGCGDDVATTSTSTSGSGGETAAGVGGSGHSSAETGNTSTGAGGTSDSTSVGVGGGGGDGPQTVADCYADAFANPPANGPDYDQFNPVVGSHCLGTNHQDITGVERVVFLGDSVTVGTPPALPGDYYRSKVADGLAGRFGLGAPSVLWKSVDLFNGRSLYQDEGAFSSCAKWGARTDDFAMEQLPSCFPQSELDKKTLVVLTMGGNDISNLTQDAIDGVMEMELWQKTEDFVQLQRDMLEWLVEPGRFPNGVYVIFGNMFEFTDGTGEVESCDVSGLAGFDEPIPSPQQLAQMVIWANEQFVKMAVDTGTDVLFMLEEFCGHGFNADNPAAPCYRGPGTETWFDMTCIHPNQTGHQHISDMFMAVVDE